MIPRQKLFPVLSLLIAATLWGVSWYPLRLLQSQGLDGMWTTLIVYSVALLIGLFLYYKHLVYFSRQPWILLLVALGNAWCNVAFILAVIDGQVMRVLLLFYLTPLWATLLGRFWLREQLSPMSWLTLALAITGALIMLWDPAMGLPWPKSFTDILAITSGMAFAVANAAVRKLQDTSIPAKNLAAWIGVVVLSVAGILWHDSSLPLVSVNVITWTVLLGGLLIMVMTYTVQYGVTHMAVHRSSIILLFELVAGAVSSQWLSNEQLGLQDWIGGFFVILAAYFSARAMKIQNTPG